MGSLEDLRLRSVSSSWLHNSNLIVSDLFQVVVKSLFNTQAHVVELNVQYQFPVDVEAHLTYRLDFCV